MEYQINNDIEIEYYDKEREKNVWGRATVREYVPTGIRVQWYDTSSASSSSASSSTAGGLFEVLFTEDKRRMRHAPTHQKRIKRHVEFGTRTASLVLARRVWYSHVEFGTRTSLIGEIFAICFTSEKIFFCSY